MDGKLIDQSASYYAAQAGLTLEEAGIYEENGVCGFRCPYFEGSIPLEFLGILAPFLFVGVILACCSACSKGKGEQSEVSFNLI